MMKKNIMIIILCDFHSKFEQVPQNPFSSQFGQKIGMQIDT